MASSIEVLVPDIGGFTDVSVIDVMVKDGQLIEKETPLITLETEKAAMDVPAPEAGLHQAGQAQARRQSVPRLVDSAARGERRERGSRAERRCGGRFGACRNGRTSQAYGRARCYRAGCRSRWRESREPAAGRVACGGRWADR